MLGLFGTLDMAARSLATQQDGMAVAGQNMANVNNPAYAEETLNIQTSAPLETSIGEEGTGANAASITETRDALLDTQIQEENSVTGSYTAQQSALQDAEAYLSEQLSNTSGSAASSANGLAATISNLFDSFQSLSTDPTSLATRQTVIQAAQQFASQFNTVSSNLSQVQAGLNTSIQNEVSTSNQDLSDIATLNQQIVLAQAGGGTADDLVDEREAKIEDLASNVNISTSAQPDGSVNISIGGVDMVTGGNNVDSLQTYNMPNGQLGVADTASSTPLSISGGSIAGNVTARDGALANLQTSLSAVANELVTNVNSIYSAGYDLNGGTGQNLFTGAVATASLTVNSAVANDPSQFQASATGGTSDNGTVLALAQLANTSLPGLNNQTITQAYAQGVADLGGAISTATDELNTSQAVGQTLTNQRSSQSGVSIDQEMTDMIQYQKAYEASAQLVTTVNQMMETLISMKTV